MCTIDRARTHIPDFQDCHGRINVIFMLWNDAWHRKKLINHFRRNEDGTLPIFTQISDPIKEIEPEPPSASYQV
jgi:hypothetical protein